MASILTQGLSQAQLESFRDKLQSMYFGGVLQSSFQGQTVIFRSRKELREALTEVTECIAELDPASTPAQGKRAKRIIISAKNDKGFI